MEKLVGAKASYDPHNKIVSVQKGFPKKPEGISTLVSANYYTKDELDKSKVKESSDRLHAMAHSEIVDLGGGQKATVMPTQRQEEGSPYLPDLGPVYESYRQW